MSSHRSFWPAFQKRWAAVLCERTEGLDVWSENMTQALRRGVLEVPNSAEAHAALARLNARLARLESVRLTSGAEFLDGTTRSLFVEYGAAILDSSSHEISHLGDPSHRGCLNYSEVKLLLGELCEWLAALKLAPRRVVSLSDLDSQILGCALARQLNVDFAVADGFMHSRSLIVSADNRALLDSSLRTVFPAQVLYSFHLHRDSGGIVPDVSGISTETLALPWQDERLTPGKINHIVEHIITATPLALPDNWSLRREFYRARRQLLTVGNSSNARPSLLPQLN